MGELDEPLWAVLSERGCEASGVAHKEALELMRALARQKVYGLCIVTAAAAARSTPQPAARDLSTPPGEAAGEP